MNGVRRFPGSALRKSAPSAYWFALGVRELRPSFTTHPDEPFGEAYGWGREWENRLTGRRFAPAR